MSMLTSRVLNISKAVPMLTGRLDMTIAVDWDVKPITKQNAFRISLLCKRNNQEIFQVIRLYDYHSLAVLPVKLE